MSDRNQDYGWRSMFSTRAWREAARLVAGDFRGRTRWSALITAVIDGVEVRTDSPPSLLSLLPFQEQGHPRPRARP
jgi:hypothetical protein